jgi:hypothetical protein
MLGDNKKQNKLKNLVVVEAYLKPRRVLASTNKNYAAYVERFRNMGIKIIPFLNPGV